MNKIISGSYTHCRLIVQRGKIWIVDKQDETQINKSTIEKYEIVDMTSSTTSRTTTSTKGTSRKSSKSMAGRAIVGGVLFGPVGAVVGAGTAKNKNKSVSSGVTTEKTNRNFKVLVSFKDGREVLLQLDERGYENFLAAAFAEPYETARKGAKNGRNTFFIIVGILIYLDLLGNYPYPVLILTIAYIVWWNYKRIKNNNKTKKNNNTSV